jgi:hypothetical protein
MSAGSSIKPGNHPHGAEKLIPLKAALRSATILFCLFLMGTSYTGAQEPAPSPKARVDRPTFAFSPTIAGTEVTHSFVIANQGEAPLNIAGVYAG